MIKGERETIKRAFRLLNFFAAISSNDFLIEVIIESAFCFLFKINPILDIVCKIPFKTSWISYINLNIQTF